MQSTATIASGPALADATDEAALGPAPWWLGGLFIFARYYLRTRIVERHINLIVSKNYLV